MLRKLGTSIALAVALLAPGARAEVVEDGVANGRFAEFVGFSDTTFVAGGVVVEPGAGEASVDLYVYDFASGFSASAWGAVPLRFAQVSGAGATLSFELAEVPGFAVQACSAVDGDYRCEVAATGRIDVALLRAGAVVPENDTSATEYPDGSVRRVTLTGWSSPAKAEGELLGVALPAGTSAKIGRYHQRVVTVDRPL